MRPAFIVGLGLRLQRGSASDILFRQLVSHGNASSMETSARPCLFSAGKHIFLPSRIYLRDMF